MCVGFLPSVERRQSPVSTSANVSKSDETAKEREREKERDVKIEQRDTFGKSS
jgi:hypothetical protein